MSSKVLSEVVMRPAAIGLSVLVASATAVRLAAELWLKGCCNAVIQVTSFLFPLSLAPSSAGDWRFPLVVAIALATAAGLFWGARRGRATLVVASYLAASLVALLCLYGSFALLLL